MDFLSNIFQNITPGKSKNIHLKEAGTLPNFISNDDKYKISSLTLSGEINGTDLRLLRDMAGYNYLGVHTNGTLHELDMTDVRIVKGGDSYVQMHVSSYYVEADDWDKVYHYAELRDALLPLSEIAGDELMEEDEANIEEEEQIINNDGEIEDE